MYILLFFAYHYAFLYELGIIESCILVFIKVILNLCKSGTMANNIPQTPSDSDQISKLQQIVTQVIDTDTLPP